MDPLYESFVNSAKVILRGEKNLGRDNYQIKKKSLYECLMCHSMLFMSS